MFDRFDYDPTSPTFLRFNQNVGVKIKSGMPAGSKKRDRIEVTVNKKQFSGARVVWELCKGEPVPEGMRVVPLDGNPHNLAIENLYLMTHQQRRTYTSLAKGQGRYNIVSNKDGTARAYFVTRRDGGSVVESLGTFENTQAAAEAYTRRKLQTFLL